ncbi:MAG: hypothetical protein U0446_08815 [Dehalococcoidia bacterium]
MLDYHREPRAGECDVCDDSLQHQLDLPYEHARVRLATVFLTQDLEIEPETTKLSSLAVSRSGLEPGPVHDLDPRHWFWAICDEPGIRLSWERSDG